MNHGRVVLLRLALVVALVPVGVLIRAGGPPPQLQPGCQVERWRPRPDLALGARAGRQWPTRPAW